MRKSTVWSTSVALSSLWWMLAARTRPWSSALLALHIPVLAWGIASLKSGFFGTALVYAPHAATSLSLTFDDGPDPALTPQVLAILQECGFKGTFFLVGEKARKHPGLVHSILAGGHTVACHDLHHRWYSNLRRAQTMRKEVSLALEYIGDACGKTPRLYRPPVGLANPHLFPVLRALGLTCVGWSHQPGDRGNRSLRGIGSIANLAGPGRIILLHDSLPVPRYRDTILGELRGLCGAARTAGLSAVTVDTLFGIDPYAD